LLAPPAAADWALLFSTDDPQYGGPGTIAAYSGTTWRIPGGSAQLFASSTSGGGPKP